METVENPLPSCKLYGNDMETIWKRFGKDPHRHKWKFTSLSATLPPIVTQPGVKTLLSPGEENIGLA